MRKLDLKRWEISVIVASFLLVLTSTSLYFSDFSLRRFLFNTDDGSETQRQVGVVGSSRGALFREQLGNSVFQSVVVKDALFNRDTVMTGNKGSALLTLADGNIIELGPGTMVQLGTETRIGLSGVTRTTQVEVVAGQVTGKTAATDMVIAVRGKRYDLARNMLQTVRVNNSLPRKKPPASRPDVPPGESPVSSAPEPRAAEPRLEEVIVSAPVPLTKENLAASTVVALDNENSPVPEPSASPAPVPAPTPVPSPETSPAPGSSASPAPFPLPSLTYAPLPSSSPSVAVSTGPSPAAPEEPAPVPTNSYEKPAKPAAKPHTKARIEILQPKPKASFSLSKGARTAELRIPVKWKVSPARAPVALIVKSVVDGKKVEVERHVPEMDGKGHPKAALVWIPKSAGTFELVIAEDLTPEQGKNIGQSKAVSVTVEKSFEGIEVLDPLVAGEKMTSNRFSGGAIKENFDLTLRWKPYSGAKTYRVQASRTANMATPFLDKTSDKPTFTLNKEKGAGSQIFYQVQAALPGGFIARSPVEQFIFDFEAPKPVVPEDHAVMSKADLSNEGDGILFTWEKTNFTDGYVLEIATDKDFKKKVLDKTQKDNFFVFKAVEPGKYYWRVKGYARKFFSKTSRPYEMVIEQ